MERRITMIISGAILALCAGIAPDANACSVPGLSPIRPAIVLPPGFTPPMGRTASVAPNSAIPIVGLWHAKYYSGGVEIDNAFDAWTSDGLEILNDYTDPIEDNVCLGTWTQPTPGTYKLEHPSWTFDTSGNLTGTVFILETVTVSGDEFNGTYTINVYDTSGNPVGSYSGTVKAVRIVPQ
ncbi:MAG TPA: hypothetical protein VMI94_26740 [Bryobacteraceae bacterium]|nr:hypothetical protein [Bryobacteraceae bacterium]